MQLFSKSPIKAAESEVIIPQEAGMEAGVLLKSQKKNGRNEEEQVKGPDVERDDLARRKALVGFTSRQEPHTFIPSSITSADMEIWQRLKLSTNTRLLPSTRSVVITLTVRVCILFCD